LAFLELHALSSCWAGFKFWAGFKPAIAQQASAAFPRLEVSQAEVCARRRARHAKKPGAVSARACCTIFSGYAFLHESRNKVKQNFSVAEFLLAYASWRSEKTAKKTITTITKQSAW
jgi:hypothetical protein